MVCVRIHQFKGQILILHIVKILKCLKILIIKISSLFLKKSWFSCFQMTPGSRCMHLREILVWVRDDIKTDVWETCPPKMTLIREVKNMDKWFKKKNRAAHEGDCHWLCHNNGKTKKLCKNDGCYIFSEDNDGWCRLYTSNKISMMLFC